MIAASTLITLGLSIQLYGIINCQTAPAIIGSIMYIIGISVGMIAEDNLNNKIKNLEKKLKELTERK